MSMQWVPKPLAWAMLGVSALTCARSASAAPAPARANAPLIGVLEAMAARAEISTKDAEKLLKTARESRQPIIDAPEYATCGRGQLVAARQWALSQGAKLSKDAPPSEGHLQSANLPIRVYFPAGKQAMAEAVLAAAEKSWNTQVVKLGFPAPWAGGELGPVEPGAWLYIAPTGDTASGVTDPLADVPATPLCDCSSRMLIGQDVASANIEGVVAHEFNHATQMATDCTESISSFENFATAVGNTLAPEPAWFGSMSSAFQKYPEYPVDFWTSEYKGAPPSAYQYGASLFPLFLLERFGGGDLTYLRDTWNSFAQNGTAVPGILFTCQPANEPNWFGGVDSMLKKSGSSFDEAFDEFSTWRAVAGALDDGQHFSFAKSLAPAATEDPLNLDSLPASVEIPLHEYGSAHVPLELPAASEPVKISIAGDPQASWGASLLLWRDASGVERRVLQFEGAKGSLVVDSFDGVSRALLVVTQKKFKTHNPDNQNYVEERSFELTLDAVLESDAGTDLDAGADAADSGSPGAAPASPQDGGCSCRAAGSPTRAGLAGLLASFLLIAFGARLRTRPQVIRHKERVR